MRTVVRAWREEADGRKARSLRIAVPKGIVEEGRHDVLHANQAPATTLKPTSTFKRAVYHA